MNKICIYLFTIFLSFSAISVYAQNDRRTAISTNAQESDIFYHTIERGQTVYSIATMYGVSVEDIYRLNPESRSVIKSGATLKIPQQQDTVNLSGQVSDESYTFHTIQPRETLYALSVRYEIPATEIIEANPGLSVSTFSIGRTIRIPSFDIEEAQASDLGISGLMDYQVERRETMYSLTRKFNISNDELLRLNPELRNGVRAGMKIRIPIPNQKATEPAVVVQPQQERDVNALLSQPRQSMPIDRIQVALLLPFTGNGQARLIEYYEGLLMAVDSMRNMGLPIELSVFDTGTGVQQLNQILRKKELLEANLIIGGIQNDQIKMIADFALEHDITHVIPFTPQNDDVLSNANVFQVNIPQSYLYARAAQAGGDLFSRDNIIILTVDDTEEYDKTEFVNTFKAELQSRSITYKELKYSSETFLLDIETVLDSTRRNVVLPTSASLTTVNNIKTPLRMLSTVKTEERDFTYFITLFGYPDWQIYTRECLEDFYALNTYIYASFYANNLSREVQNFYTLYKNWYSKDLINTFPKYGIVGFDTGMFFFSAMRRYGLNFENYLDDIDYKSVQTGFHFERVNNWGGFINTNLYIVQYRNNNTVIRTSVRR